MVAGLRNSDCGNGHEPCPVGVVGVGRYARQHLELACVLMISSCFMPCLLACLPADLLADFRNSVSPCDCQSSCVVGLGLVYTPGSAIQPRARGLCLNTLLNCISSVIFSRLSGLVGCGCRAVGMLCMCVRCWAARSGGVLSPFVLQISMEWLQHAVSTCSVFGTLLLRGRWLPTRTMY